MRLKLATTLSALLFLFLSFAAIAQSKVVRGEGVVSVKGSMASGPSETDRATALSTAKLAAWRSYLATPGQNELVDLVRSNENAFLDQIDNILVDIVTVDENFNKDSYRYTVRIKATVAESVVNSIIRGQSKTAARQSVSGNSAASGRQANSVLGNTPIMFLGMAREADVVKSFLDKQTNVSEVSRDSESTRTKVASGGKAQDMAMSTERTKEATGGNRERKRDKVTYRVGNVSILNSKLPRALLQSGIKSSPYAFIMKPCQLPDPDVFSKQYAASEAGELPSKVLAQIQENLASCSRVKYWVFASMDVGGYGTDPNSGLSLVTVTVNVQLYEVDSGSQLASASKDVPGRSADQSDAIKVATENAVQAVGDIITSQIASIN
jgi:hypothetical protein